MKQAEDDQNGVSDGALGSFFDGTGIDDDDFWSLSGNLFILEVYQ